MAATNFTPIILYHTTTASATPSAGNLNNGELAINITDGKLFYKDNGGTVQVIATKGTGTIGGSTTQVQYNNAGALAGSANFTFNGTTATINTLNLTNALGTTFGGTGLNAYTTGDLVYASGTNTLAKLGIGLNTYILTSTGSVPQWSAPSAVTVATATNLAGGAAGSVPYQSGASTTTFLSIGTQNQVLTSSGTAPQWSSGLTITTLATTGNTTLGDAAADNLTVNATITSNLIFTDNTYDIGASGATRPRSLFLGTNLTVGSLTATRVPYASTGGLLVDSANMTFNGTRLTVADFADSSLTAGRVTYATTSGNLTDSANLLYSGTDLTVYGITVGRGAGAVATNTAVGASALAANTTGSTNTAIGAQAGLSITTGVNLTAVGYQAARVTTGNNTTAIGTQALLANTTGTNTAVGFSALYVNTTGTDNVAVGASALVSNTTGQTNSAVGHGALQANTTASNNTAVGYQAGYTATTATQSIYVGGQAGYSTTTGSYNTFVGFQAAQGNTTGYESVAIGHTALTGGTTGRNNIAIGYQAMVGVNTGDFNVAVGGSSLATNTSGAWNAALGKNTLLSNTTGAYNVAIGGSALNSNTTASNNTAVGYQAGYSNTTGTNSVYLGYQAAYTNITGGANTAVGHQALRSNTTADYNTAIGYQAGYSNSSGLYNYFSGAQAGYSNTTGSYNAFAGGLESGGYGAGHLNTTGSFNTAFGSGALKSNTTANFNTAIGYAAGILANRTADGNGFNTFVGYFAGASVTTGNQNTFLGSRAGASVTTGTYNTYVGEYAGYNATTGNNNTFVGVNSVGYLMTTGSKNTIIGGFSGNQGGLDIRTASNYIVLSDGDGNPRFIVNSGGNAIVGNNTGAPSTWVSGDYNGLEIGSRGNSIYGGQGGFNPIAMTSNAYVSSGGTTYTKPYSSASGLFRIQGTVFTWSTSSSTSTGQITDLVTALSLEQDKSLALQGATAQTGTGITFPATQSASSNANTLDDYEEGSWTPTFLSDGGTTGTQTNTNSWGRYVKVGRQVTVWFKWSGTLSGFTGTLQVGGLPFSVGTSTDSYQYGGNIYSVSSTATASNGSNFLFFAYSGSLYPVYTTGQVGAYLFTGSSQINGITEMNGSHTHYALS